MRPHALLEVRDVSAGYNSVPVIRDVTLSVGKGEAVVLLGANGAGKSTLLRAISNLIRSSKGSILLNGEEIGKEKIEALPGKGLSHVAEGRRIFRKQSVESNLEIGLARSRLSRVEIMERIEEQYQLFPILREKRDQMAGALSGGQQQMLAISQGLTRRPSVLMLDEPSIGLAPIMIEEVFEKLEEIRAQGVSILLVEQIVERSLEFADFSYLMQGGKIITSGVASELVGSTLVKKAYLGVA
jgi:branched-chain amino acid transport system ATP-binding protein